MSYIRNRGNAISPILVLIGVNVVILIAAIINENVIYSTFGLQPYFFVRQPLFHFWTILTYSFVHGGFGHLLGNVITLYFFGNFLIALVGETQFLATYFIGGIMGGIMCILLPSSPFDIVVGASGALYAVGGALVMLRPKEKVYIIPIPVPIPLWVAILGGFLIISFIPGIAWQAHLGGLIYGLAIGFYYSRKGR